jgi:hypothetical protein
MVLSLTAGDNARSQPKPQDRRVIVANCPGSSQLVPIDLNRSRSGQICVIATVFEVTRYSKVVARHEFWRFGRKKRTPFFWDLYTGQTLCRAVCRSSLHQKAAVCGGCLPWVRPSVQVRASKGRREMVTAPRLFSVADDRDCDGSMPMLVLTCMAGNCWQCPESACGASELSTILAPPFKLAYECLMLNEWITKRA